MRTTVNRPPFRKLRGYAFDPSLSLDAATASMNMIVYKIKWEKLEAGPCGEYVEVIDYDPTVERFYQPVNLDDAYVLAQDGLDPSESNPLFHQQMVYSVAMTTIRNFEQALGRKILWATRRVSDENVYEEYVPKLRIYPHALRDANAFYSPQKKALLFGYFSSSPADITLQMPGSLVFTCLSHDIIAHETTHAILDGLHRHYNEATNPDVLAFHEAFADMVALFQHFTFPEVLKHQIMQTKGNLEAQNMLGKLAQQFGTAVGCYGSLRDAIGHLNEDTHQWEPTKPNADDYRLVMEPHKRGSILVAAIFEAFINIYKGRAADLLRIASNGTGILPQGELHPDLVNRLANEASKSARHVLYMCIRALDYCPPVDINFGDYLRAIITADLDLVSDDEQNYRLLFIEAFRRRGIYPQGLKTLSIDSLRYTLEPKVSQETERLLGIIGEFLRDFQKDNLYATEREDIFKVAKSYSGGNKGSVHGRITSKFENSAEFERLTGLVLGYDWDQLGIKTSTAYIGKQPGPSFQVTGLRVVTRVGPAGNNVNQIRFSLIQRCGVVVQNGIVTRHYIPDSPVMPEGAMELKGGCTLIFDLDTVKLRYAISRPLLFIDPLSGERTVDTRRAINQYN